ncbi:MAG: hypothetical protein ACKPKO_58505, partial [Candidatus Fonsibacter sp.]
MQHLNRHHDDVKRVVQETTAEYSALEMRMATIEGSYANLTTERYSILREELEAYKERESLWVTELHRARRELSEMTTEHEGFRKQMNTEVCVLFQECSSYADEFKVASDYVKRQEMMNAHIENQVTTWKEESRAI